MSVTPIVPNKMANHRSYKRRSRVYAIAFDLDTKILESRCGHAWNSCYAKIERVLLSHGFSRQQGSLYFGDENSNPVSCIKAVQELDQSYLWFGAAVKDIRMLRIDEDNDLLPILIDQLRLDQTGAA